MPNYILFLHMNPNRPRPSSPDEALAITKTYVAWTDRIRAEGRHRAGQKLTNDAGKIMQSKGGRTSITDGPFAESKGRDRRLLGDQRQGLRRGMPGGGNVAASRLWGPDRGPRDRRDVLDLIEARRGDHC
jgi:hypothetical protein